MQAYSRSTLKIVMRLHHQLQQCIEIASEGERSMRRSTMLAATLAMLLTAGSAAYFAFRQSDERVRAEELHEFIVKSRSDYPSRGLGHDWFDCQNRYWSEANKAADRVVCETWTQQGVTSTLIALKFGTQRIPVVESRLAEAGDGGPIVLDIQGGPGGEPFQVSEGMSDELIARLRRNDPDIWIGGDVRKSPYYQLLARGYTVASIGYWGMGLATRNAPDEFDLAVLDVRMALKRYRDIHGADLPLITVSLGNHLALAALGKERIEKMNVLALVPVMDGLQHHLKKSAARMAEEKNQAREESLPLGEWVSVNIYRQSDDDLAFNESRMLPMEEFVPKYLGDADYPWRDITPIEPCSKIVLGDKDPRTMDYLATNSDLPNFVRVLHADHVLFKDALEESRTIFADFADCVSSDRM